MLDPCWPPPASVEHGTCQLKTSEAGRILFERLQRWYQSECNEDWEHSYGVKIDTLDNPGWMVTIDLFETPWADLTSPRRFNERSEGDWIHTEISGSRFVGYGGPLNLGEIVEEFFRILDQNPRPG